MIGTSKPQTLGDKVDSKSGQIFMMRGQDYIVPCCGAVSQWTVYIKKPGTIRFQIWRPFGNGSYDLIGENLATYNRGEEDNVFTVHVEVGDQVGVREGDLIGWYNNRAPMIGYAKLKSGIGALIQTSRTPVDIGALMDWSDVQSTEPRGYALQAVVTKVLRPKIKNLDNDIQIFDNILNGTEVYKLAFEDTSENELPTSASVFMHITSEYFSYNQTLNSVFVTLTPKNGKYTLEFTIRDHCGNEDTGKLKVEVQRKLPSILNLPSAVSVREDIRNVEILLFQISVVHSSDVACDLRGSDPPEGKTHFLARNYNTSAPAVYLKSTAELSYRAADTYELTIRCSAGKESDTAQLFVNVIPNAVPHVSNLPASTTVNANMSTVGDAIFYITWVDGEDDQVAFNVTCEQSNCPFSITDLGTVLISEDLRLSEIDAYNLRITAFDSYNKARPAILLVNVTGLNVAPYIFNIPSGLKLPMEENTPVGTEIFQVAAADQNVNDILKFSMTMKPTTMSTFFAINESSGLIFITMETNFESLSSKSVKLYITVSDGIHTDKQTLKMTVIDINEAPVFERSNYTVLTSEGKADHVVVKGTVKAKDEDKDDVVLYSLTCATMENYFKINEKNGDIEQAYELDVDKVGLGELVVDCVVFASDKSGLTSNATLQIIVSDEDDNDPDFIRTSYLFVTTRDLPVFSVIGSATAIDIDTAPENRKLFYAFLEDTIDFVVDDNGTIYLIADLTDVSIGTVFKLSLSVEDNHGSKDTVPVTVVVLAGDHTSLVTSLLVEEKTFFDLPENIAWFVSALHLLLLLLMLLVYLCGRSFKCTVRLRQYEDRRIVSPSVWNDLDANGDRRPSVFVVSPANSDNTIDDYIPKSKKNSYSNNASLKHLKTGGISNATWQQLTTNLKSGSPINVFENTTYDTARRRHSLVSKLSSEDLPPVVARSRISLSDIHTKTDQLPASPWKPWSISDFKNFYRGRQSKDWTGRDKMNLPSNNFADRRKSLNF
ncbi:protocadherin Fat 2-like [Mya arenaria]|uniref:protocadherin Fat 2-like n=1 Tax=Mya arenaria TaxID=6604 RepID=UPI0022E53A50|nr:protocadherin Fat 2-like [Mya arenaria]